MIVYRNNDTKIIRELLKEIGKLRYEKVLEDMNVTDKPNSMKGWYLESMSNEIMLCYRYPSRYVLIIMDVVKFNNIPTKGWELIITER